MAKNPATLGWYVYRTYNASGRLLYVGCSRDPEVRLKQHWCSLWFPECADVTLERHWSRQAALDAELDAIKTEWPLWNVQGSPDAATVREEASRAGCAELEAIERQQYRSVRDISDHCDEVARMVRRALGEFLLRVDMAEVDALAKPIPAATA